MMDNTYRPGDGVFFPIGQFGVDSYTITDRRLMYVCVSSSCLSYFLTSTGKHGINIVVDGVPEGAKMLHIKYDFEDGLFYILFRHGSFCEILPHCDIPKLTPVIKTIRDLVGEEGAYNGHK